MQRIWIDGVLTQSLHHAARIDLHLQDRPDVLVNPWRLQVQETDQAPKSLPAGTSIVQVYDGTDGELLILGEPGAGKTTLLLELARTLLERAEQNERLHMPVVFNLSSWAEKRQPLRTWLVEELRTKYQIPHKIGQGWVEADQVLPLLDGLDEVAKDARTACVKQINDYYQSRLEGGSSPIVVCCRSEEYAALSTRVMLQHAVSILPLTDSQINSYLEQAGGQVQALRHALDEDTELYNLARQPLMLNIFTLAYQGARASDVPTGETREEMRHTIFARYVERMLGRRGAPKRAFREHMLQWLTFLAVQMQRHHQTVFYLEHLQSDWLIAGQKRRLYRLSVGLVTGLTSELPIAVILALIYITQGTNLLTTLLGSFIFALPIALVFGLVLGLSQIQPRERVTRSWRVTKQSIVQGMISMLASGLIIMLLYVAYGMDLYNILLAPFVFALPIALTSMLVFGFFAKQLDDRTRLTPNQGIWSSAQSGLIIGLIFGFIIGLIFGYTFGLIFGLIVGLVVGLIAGLGAFLQHFTLRFWLCRTGRLPWNLVTFLDEATERLLLRRVGGGYLFVHRMLLDYFAELDEKEGSHHPQ